MVTQLQHTKEIVDVAIIAPELAVTPAREDADAKLETLLQKVENANLLVVGTPVVNGSCTGLLKHLLDLVRPSISHDAVAIVAATDRGDCNFLALEFSLRPLLRQLGYYTVPTAVFARDDDFVDLYVAQEAVILGARRAVGDAFQTLGLDPPFTAFLAGLSAIRATCSS
jgi:FMN reductase